MAAFWQHVRELDLSRSKLRELDALFSESQRLLRVHVRPMLLGWLEELKVEEFDARTYAPNKVDGFCLQMASVHAHMILVLRNVPPQSLELSDVRQLLLSERAAGFPIRSGRDDSKPLRAAAPHRAACRAQHGAAGRLRHGL